MDDMPIYGHADDVRHMPIYGHADGHADDVMDMLMDMLMMSDPAQYMDDGPDVRTAGPVPPRSTWSVL